MSHELIASTGEDATKLELAGGDLGRTRVTEPKEPVEPTKRSLRRDSDPLLQKLGRFVGFNDAELDALKNLSRSPLHELSGTNLISEGEKPNHVFLLTSGWAYRYKQLEDGKRQIMTYLVPGDLCDI